MGRLTDLRLLIPKLSIIVHEQSVVVVNGDVFDAEFEKIIEISVDRAGLLNVRLGDVGFEFADRFVDVIAAQAGRLVVVVQEGLVITDFFERVEIEACGRSAADQSKSEVNPKDLG